MRAIEPQADLTECDADDGAIVAAVPRRGPAAIRRVAPESQASSAATIQPERRGDHEQPAVIVRRPPATVMATPPAIAASER